MHPEGPWTHLMRRRRSEEWTSSDLQGDPACCNLLREGGPEHPRSDERRSGEPAGGRDLYDAARAMRDSDSADVIVVDDSEQLCGIASDRDVTIRAIAKRRDLTSTKLAEICSRQPHPPGAEDSVSDALRLMTGKAIRRLPVVQAGKLVGVVSLGDLARRPRDPEFALADISGAPPND